LDGRLSDVIPVSCFCKYNCIYAFRLTNNFQNQVIHIVLMPLLPIYINQDFLQPLESSYTFLITQMPWIYLASSIQGMKA
jgi:hypothetical protein